ncbi:hypothetical protein [Methylovulum psychrotolerans]|nr:hypothetical protein [Methylovulum psychrotolerans]
MPRHPELYQWIDTIATHFPSLSKPQALGGLDVYFCQYRIAFIDLKAPQ